MPARQRVGGGPRRSFATRRSASASARTRGLSPVYSGPFAHAASRGRSRTPTPHTSPRHTSPPRVHSAGGFAHRDLESPPPPPPAAPPSPSVQHHASMSPGRARAPAPEPTSSPPRQFGVVPGLPRTRVLVITREERQPLGLSYRTSRQGVRVTYVSRGSPAAKAGLAVGQELISVCGGRVSNAAEADAAFGTAPSHGGQLQCAVVVAEPAAAAAVRSLTCPPQPASGAAMSPPVPPADPEASSPNFAGPPVPHGAPCRGSSRTLSLLPDPQLPRRKGYSSGNYTSRREHPAGLGFGKQVRCGYGPVIDRVYPPTLRTPTGPPRPHSARRTRSPKAPALPLPGGPAWQRLVADAAAVGIAEADIPMLFWSTVEGLCMHFGMNDKEELAAVQAEWRRRHVGTDDPHPIVPPQPVPLPVDVQIPAPLPPPEPLLLPPPPPPPVPCCAIPAPLAHAQLLEAAWSGAGSPRRWQSSPAHLPQGRRQDPRGPPGKLDWAARPRVDTGVGRWAASRPTTA
eukprot:TRINITY_DN79_c3_g1_i1.p1 TRINITY_DN79_c3_g1~~TRINITY_DN79_c3_g1_i1.p1  ORF type:complete len:543 (+),score=95.27 TRINITY_DN79_c3_g1_i1:90-1631(+)